VSLLTVLAATLFVLLYLRWPFDLVPDSVGALGLLDDLAVLLATVWWVRTRRRAATPPLRHETRVEEPWDPYAVLGVRRGATREEVVRAYHEQMKRYHPDRVANLGEELRVLAHEKVLAIQRAYAELG